jgi:hypothetical protein
MSDTNQSYSSQAMAAHDNDAPPETETIAPLEPPPHGYIERRFRLRQQITLDMGPNGPPHQTWVQTTYVVYLKADMTAEQQQTALDSYVKTLGYDPNSRTPPQ